MKHSVVIFSIICIGLLVLGCGMFPQLAGDTSETGNTFIVGKVTLPSGAGMSKAQVMLIPAAYNPVSDGPVPDSCIDTTDESGNYMFLLHGPEGRRYNLQVVHIRQRTRTIVVGVTAGRDTTLVQDAVLENPGSIRVILPDGVDIANGYLYLPGTNVFMFLAGAGAQVMLDSVPAATLPAVCFMTKNATVPTVLRYNVRVLSGATAVVAMPDWKYSAPLYLNTTSSGAGVAGNVVNFPVLVRLTAGNFDFSQATSNGADIRFAKSDNTILPCEIERWDPAAGRAEIWVRVDTVRGDDSIQSITLYWGNPHVSDSSKDAAVFDSASGFEGVWHLSETSGTRAADASYNGFSGTYRGALPKNVSGPTGICQNIVKTDSDYIDIGDVLNPGAKNISVGVWVKRASFGSPQALIAKTNGDTPSSAFGFLFSFDPYNFPRFHMASGGANWGDDGTFNVSSNLAITDSTTWHQVFAVIDRSDNSRCKIYVDGVDKTGSTQGTATTVTAVANALRLHIGTESDNNCSYKGAIGEATVAFTARSADWVKLSYMNQKEQDALVKFK